MIYLLSIIATTLILIITPAFAQAPKMDPMLQCQTQLAETTWSYESLIKDRQDKERQRDKAEVRAYILEKDNQRLQKQVRDLQEAAKPQEKKE